MTEKPYLPQPPKPDDKNLYQWFVEIWKKLGKAGALLGSIRFGSADSYTGFEEDGTMVAHGNATTWDDLNGSALQLKVQGSGLSINAAQNTLEYLTSANQLDYAYDNYQMRHTWVMGTTIKPHIHWVQVQNNIPNMLLQYRWQINGATTTTAWSNVALKRNAFTYTTGSLNQITSVLEGITPPVGASLSDVLEFHIIRDSSNWSGLFASADPYTVTWSVKFVDIHIQSDTLGSRQEYTK